MPTKPTRGSQEIPQFESLEPRLLLDVAAPLQPDLLAASDSGVSDSDDYTNVTTPMIQIEATEAGHDMRVYVDATYVGNATLVSGTTFQITFTTGQLTEGESTITARSFDGVEESPGSPALTVELDTTAPVAMSHLGGGDGPKSVDTHVVGSLAYVAANTYGLQIFDISDPAAPVLVGSYDTEGYAADVEVVGTLAYVADYGGGMQIIDVTTPSAPVWVGEYSTSSCRGVTVAGSFAYLAAGSYMHVVDVSNPAAPVGVAIVGSPFGWTSYAQDVTVAGSLAYLTASQGNFHIYDISNPYDPDLTSDWSYYSDGHFLDCDVVGSLVYAATNEGTLVILDVSDPLFPSRVGVSDVLSPASSVSVAGSVAYLGTRQGLAAVDISDPSSPVLLNIYDTEHETYSVEVAGSVAFLCSDDGMETVALSVPALDLMYSSDTGPYNDDDVTDDTTPELDAPNAEPGNYARIYRDGTQVTGDWDPLSVTLGTQPYGTFDYTARTVDAAGNVSELSAPLEVTITTLPTAPEQPDLLPGGDSGVSDSDNITNVTTPTIRIETTQPGLPVKVYVDEAYVGDATLVSGTTFEYTFTEGQLAEGNNRVAASSIEGSQQSIWPRVW